MPVRLMVSAAVPFASFTIKSPVMFVGVPVMLLVSEPPFIVRLPTF